MATTKNCVDFVEAKTAAGSHLADKGRFKKQEWRILESQKQEDIDLWIDV